MKRVYYVTVDGTDYSYPSTKERAIRDGKRAKQTWPDTNVRIEVYTGKFHGSGGSLVTVIPVPIAEVERE